MKEQIEKNTNNTIEEVKEKPYTFRKLSTQDIFPMLKLMNKIGIKELKDDESVKNLLAMMSGSTVKGKADPAKLGIDMFFEIACILTENIPKCENELYALLSQTSNLEVKDIKEQDMATTFEMIIDFVKKEEFGDFFRAVSKLFK